jgi:ATP-dependent Zn protease
VIALPSDSREITAYHEAGHAVAAMVLGRPVAWVSIRPDRIFLGQCAFGKGVIRPSEDWVEREAIIALAGPAAEAGFTGEMNWPAAARDHDYAFSLARGRGGDDKRADRLVKRWLAKADHLLGRGQTWDAVERIAAELVRLEEISGRAARHLFRG